MHIFVLLAAMLGADPAATADVSKDDHWRYNPVYHELVSEGIPFGAGQQLTLPAPTFTAGDTEAEVRAKLDALPGSHPSADQLLRSSMVAPLVIEFREIELSDAAAPVHGVDLWFIAYGDLELLTQKEFLEQLQPDHSDADAMHQMTPEELQQRDIQLATRHPKQERYVFGQAPVLDKVQVSVVSRTFIGRTDDSLMIASLVDPRFADDEKYANRWRSMQRGSGGQFEFGPAQPYGHAGAYVKITRLAAPAGALAVEYHLLYSEPNDWFGGVNLLRSKLPMMIQQEVRSFRRHLAKAAKDPDAREAGRVEWNYLR